VGLQSACVKVEKAVEGMLGSRRRHVAYERVLKSGVGEVLCKMDFRNT
jgi:hypothetical protein